MRYPSRQTAALSSRSAFSFSPFYIYKYTFFVYIFVHYYPLLGLAREQTLIKNFKKNSLYTYCCQPFVHSKQTSVDKLAYQALSFDVDQPPPHPHPQQASSAE